MKTFGITITRMREDKRERVVSLHPNRTPLGTVLLSRYVDPFCLKPGESIPNSHTVYWDCVQVAKTFVDLGYSVDVIDSQNGTFRPQKRYSFFVGHQSNFDRLAGLLKEDCIKIAYLDTAHWAFNNQAIYQQKFELLKRKGVVIEGSHRLVEWNLAIEHADYGILYGNDHTLSTYRYANKPLFQVPMSTCALLPWPEHKGFDTCRTNFLWFGSHGFVHKGLDLALEAFASLPEYHLYVCGPMGKEKEFVEVYDEELYHAPNIHTIGWVDVNGPEFVEIANRCVGLVFPSCSEGQAGAVTTSMHAGLIPLVSYESGVDVDDFGVVFKDHRIGTIKDTVRQVAQLSAESLRWRARRAWECARATYTRERFTEEFKKTILSIVNINSRGSSSNPGLPPEGTPLRPAA